MADKPAADIVASEPSRRAVIKSAAAALAVASGLPPAQAQAAPSLPEPSESGIDHIVVLMMENRSFDHILGWAPGANGVQAGRTFHDRRGYARRSHRLTLYQNCASHDPDHSWRGGRIQLNGGAMDGFLFTQRVRDVFPIGYYGPEDVPFFAASARNWTVCDAYHCGILGPTWPNRIYMHAGQTDRIRNTSFISDLPTIWDRAAAASVSAKHYYSDRAFTVFWGDKYASISQPFSHFQADAASGNLPSISYIDPRVSGEHAGLSNDDHPLADIRNGQVFMNEVYTALSSAPTWAKTLLVINYDEWGGFADHVAPQLAAVSAAEATAGNVDVHNAAGTPLAYLGFRTPLLLIGPRARRGVVSHAPFDPNAILNFICWRFGLPGLGVRAATSGNLATAFDFSAAPNPALPPPVDLPRYNPDAAISYGGACADNPTADMEEINKGFGEHFAGLEDMRQLMVRYGFRMV